MINSILVPNLEGCNLSVTSSNCKSESARSAPLSLGLVTARNGSVQKKIIEINGKPAKDPNHSLSISSGYFQNQSVNGLDGLAELLSNLNNKQCLTLGVSDYAGTLGMVSDDKLEFLKNRKDITFISRTKEYVKKPSGNFLLLLDHDAEPGKAELSTEQFWNALCGILPALASVGRLVTPSSSSAIYDKATGELLKPETSHHTYIVCKGDIDRLTDLLKLKGWLSGTSFFKLGEPNRVTGTSSILERHILDLAVFSFERLVYEAGASFDSNSPFYQKRSLPVVHDGAVLDCDSLEVPSDEDRAKAKKIREAARKAIAPERFKAAVQHIEKVEKLANPEAVARKRLDQCDRGVLTADHILHGIDGSSYRAGDLNESHDGLRLADPQEPQYRCGAQVAKFYWHADGWKIHSQAHGGKTYSLANDKKEQQIEEKLAKLSAKDASALLWELQPPCLVPLDTTYIGSAIADAVRAGRDGVFVFAPCGSGKSTAIQLLAKVCEQLGRQLVYLTDKEQDAISKSYELGISYRKNLNDLEKGEYPSFGACFAAIRDDARFVSWLANISRTAVFVIDEADAALEKVRDGGADSLRTMSVLRAMLPKVGCLVAMSAQLKSSHIQQLTDLAGLTNTVTLGTTKAPHTRSITLYPDTASKASGSLTAQHKLKELLQAGKKCLIMTSGQRGDSSFSTLTFESLITKYWGCEQPLLIDSLSTHDPSSPAFKFGERDQISLLREYKSAVSSPSAANSYSFDFGEDEHYDHIFVFDNGNVPLGHLIQKMARDRGCCPVHMTIKPITSMPFDGITEPTLIHDRLIMLYESGGLPKLLSDITDNDQRPEWSDPYVRFFCESHAQENAANANRELNITRYAESIGHSVYVAELLDEETEADFSRQLRSQKEAIKNEFHIAIQDSIDLDKETAKALRESKNRSKDEYLSLIKWDLLVKEKLINFRQIDEDGNVVTLENPAIDLEVTAGMIDQLSKQKLGKPWRLHRLAEHGAVAWDCVESENIGRRRSSNKDRDSQLLTAADYVTLDRTKLALLDEFGFIEFFKKWIVQEVPLELVVDAIAAELSKPKPDLKNTIPVALQDAIKGKGFTAKDKGLSAIVSKLNEGDNFDTFCARLGIQSVRNKAGLVTHAQVLTILRQFFSFKSYRSARMINKVKGVFLLCADDRFNALAKRSRAIEKMPHDERMSIDIESDISEAYCDGVARVDLFPVWDEGVNTSLVASGIDALDADDKNLLPTIRYSKNIYIANSRKQNNESNDTVTIDDIDFDDIQTPVEPKTDVTGKTEKVFYIGRHYPEIECNSVELLSYDIDGTANIKTSLGLLKVSCRDVLKVAA